MEMEYDYSIILSVNKYGRASVLWLPDDCPPDLEPGEIEDIILDCPAGVYKTEWFWHNSFDMEGAIDSFAHVDQTKFEPLWTVVDYLKNRNE